MVHVNIIKLFYFLLIKANSLSTTTTNGTNYVCLTKANSENSSETIVSYLEYVLTVDLRTLNFIYIFLNYYRKRLI